MTNPNDEVNELERPEAEADQAIANFGQPKKELNPSYSMHELMQQAQKTSDRRDAAVWAEVGMAMDTKDGVRDDVRNEVNEHISDSSPGGTPDI